jgi:hypothetical protein
MPEPVHEPETSPWDETPAAFGGETRAFPRMSFEEMEQMASASQPSFDEPPAFHEPPPPPAAEASPWDEPHDDAATRAIPKMSFEEMQQLVAAPQTSSQPAEPPPFETLGAPASEPEASPWDETPAAFGGETRAFPRMSFEEMEQMASANPAGEPAWAPAADPFAATEQTESPFAAEETPEATAGTAVNSQITDDAYPTAVNSQITDDVNSQITDDVNPQITDLTEEQVDRIARRVVQLMSEQVVRNIAWEVIPDLAEMVVKERIRQLEAEA